MKSVKVRYETGKLRHEVYVGQHHMVTDEPVDLGGEDMGPAPFDFLAAGLGACTAITLRMYAQRKSWPLENAEVTVHIQKSSESHKFIRNIELFGDLTEEQKLRLIEIANKCPVHKALSGKIEIETNKI